MKNVVIVLAFVLVAVAAFLIGKSSGTGDKPAAEQAPAQVQQPAPAPQAPTPPPVVKQAAEPAPQGKAEVFPVSPMSDKPVDREIAIPAGTVPSRDASASKGPKTAPVIYLVVSDFQCPVCKRAHEGLMELARDFPDKVRYVFKHNPLAMHKNALNASAASLAAGRQGRFWEYADLLFQDQRALSEADLMNTAQKLKLDMAKFKKDYEDPALRLRAKTEGEVASALGAQGTPAFFVNGKLQVGWASYGAVRQQIENEIRAVEALTAQGMNVKQAREERVKANLPEGYQKFLNSPLGNEYSEF